MHRYFLFLVIFLPCVALAQVPKYDTINTAYRPTDSLAAAKSPSVNDVVAVVEAQNNPAKVQIISPTRAGLYSAVLPGLGQYYNRKYWKIPLVWGLIGTSVGIVAYQNKQYKRYRDAFVAEINGQPNEFSGLNIPDLRTALGRQQDTNKRYRDYWIAITAGVYLLNILDAVVDAHLYEGRRDPDLALRPTFIINELDPRASLQPGLALQFKF